MIFISTVLNALITMVTGCFASIVAWVPILIMAGFTIVNTATGIVTKIVSRKSRRRGR